MRLLASGHNAELPGVGLLQRLDALLVIQSGHMRRRTQDESVSEA